MHVARGDDLFPWNIAMISKFANGKYITKYSTQVFIAAFLAISVLAIYYQVKDFDFIYYDDPKYIRDNPMVGQGITPASVRWAFSSIGYASNWHPLTWFFHMFNVELFGLDPGIHHLINVFIHIANTILLFFLFFRMTGETWKSAAVAALFALHPLHVESVAWIAELKDVLSTFFLMLTIWCYVLYVEHPGKGRYFRVILVYTLGLLAKPMLVTLPFILLLLDFWPIKRADLIRPVGTTSPRGIKNLFTDIHWNRVSFLIGEKIPLFVLAGISSWITFIAQTRGGAVSSLDVLPLGYRVENAAVAYNAFLLKMVWPFHLAVFYPYSKAIAPLLVGWCIFFLIGVTLLVLRFSRDFPFLLVGWLWYLGTLVPVIGLVQVGLQSMADRYTYIPLIGISLMLVWGVATLFQRWRTGMHVLTGISILIIPVLTWATWVQAGYWKDSVTLFDHALKVTKNNYLAHTNMAAALLEKGDVPGALSHSHEALKLRPNDVPALCNIGLGLMRQGRYQDAIDQFRRVLLIDPDYVNAHQNLGTALYTSGRTEDAIKEFQEVLRLNPQHPGAIKYIELASARQRKVDTAIAQLNDALKVEPQNDTLHFKLAELYRSRGNTKDAIIHYEKTLSIRPDFKQALHTIARLYAGNGDLDKSLLSLQTIKRLNPDDPEVYYNIACIYSRQGRVDEAVKFLAEAIRRGFQHGEVLNTDPDLENIRGTEFYKNLMTGDKQ
jgi:protein O-mannosyl-transferase